jgi:2-polyprenyl-3-methyl-5-hydroxy-6-metoxy-1,4-benzoquinol methylase
MTVESAIFNYSKCSKVENVAMNAELSGTGKTKLRFLVVIASFGEKNLPFLRKIIHQYQSMTMEVDVVVVSDAPKELDPSVKVVVGLPSKNPWSLPFAHKSVLAENLDRYDLFAYSEDDMDVSEENIQAFLKVSPSLHDDEIAGFLRYEIDPSGGRSLPETHGPYHWKADSVQRRGSETVAEFSNDHAAFYLLTQSQLRRAIASGGFLQAPYEGRYGMLETAATDPYTCCGFHRVICITALQDFLIHHMSNRYAGQLGLPLATVHDQIETLIKIRDGLHPASTLGQFESKLLHGRWSKSYYERACRELLAMIPPEASNVLSVGCGVGNIEVALQERGAQVTALPLDSVVGAAASRLGIEVIYGELGECLENLGGRKFQSVLITNLLHLMPNPFRLLTQCAGLVDEGGDLLISGVNFDYLPILIKRALGQGEYRKLKRFDESGINVLRARAVIQQLKRLGMSAVSLRWANAAQNANLSSVKPWLSRGWIVQARKKSNSLPQTVDKLNFNRVAP